MRDTINGGRGSDELTGGSGADLFTYASKFEFGDEITDFNHQEKDAIGLHIDELYGSLVTANGKLPVYSVYGGIKTC